MSIDDKINWSKTTWEGSRREQLKSSLKLTPKQRFEALEAFAKEFVAVRHVEARSVIANKVGGAALVIPHAELDAGEG